MKIITTIAIFFSCISLAFLITGCRKNTDKASPATPLELKPPASFPAPNYLFEGNPLTQQGFDLGRKLFYDGRLSKDGKFPCASCHQQSAAFATFEHDLSHGYNNQYTTRNAPGIFNLLWQKEYNWDGAITNLEAEPLSHITASNEMAEDVNNVVNKLKADDQYRQLFKAAFGDEEVNAQRMLKALAQFTGSLISANAKYDKVKRGEESFTFGQQAGYAVFQSKCAACHQEPLFSDQRFRNTGMSLNNVLLDYGRMSVTNKKEDSLKFKVPSLRNVALTFPYGHDGRFWSLDEVLDHYTTGIQDGPTLDPLLKNKITLTSTERSQLKQFLSTLTDTSFVNNPRFSAPQ
jgi:cytochrome c peroxidase